MFYVDLQSSWEGVKQGDTVSSMLYSIVAHHYIYGPLIRAFPALTTSLVTYEETPIAIIDDFTPIIDCPPIDAPVCEWREWYIKAGYYVSKFDEIANPIGIFRNASKDKLLLPAGAPLPPPVLDTYGIDLAAWFTYWY